MDLKQKWNELKTGYKFKVYFEGQTELKTLFIKDRSLVVYSARRSNRDRQYDSRYTVYVYSVNDSELKRVKQWDTKNIVSCKEMAVNAVKLIEDKKIEGIV
jgi:hypothetical protein